MADLKKVFIYYINSLNFKKYSLISKYLEITIILHIFAKK